MNWWHNLFKMLTKAHDKTYKEIHMHLCRYQKYPKNHWRLCWHIKWINEYWHEGNCHEIGNQQKYDKIIEKLGAGQFIIQGCRRTARDAWGCGGRDGRKDEGGYQMSNWILQIKKRSKHDTFHSKFSSYSSVSYFIIQVCLSNSSIFMSKDG